MLRRGRLQAAFSFARSPRARWQARLVLNRRNSMFPRRSHHGALHASGLLMPHRRAVVTVL